MYKKQMTFQRVICMAVLVACALIFVYSLGLMTDLQCIYDKNIIRDPSDLDASRVDGARIYYDMQAFNKQLTDVSVVMLLISLLLFITCCHSRRKYYAGNYFAICACSVSNVAGAIWTFMGVSKYHEQFKTQLDVDGLVAYLEKQNASGLFSGTEFWFDIGYVICAILLVVTVLLLANLVLKIIVMKEEKRLIGSRKDVTA